MKYLHDLVLAILLAAMLSIMLVGCGARILREESWEYQCAEQGRGLCLEREIRMGTLRAVAIKSCNCREETL